MNAFETKHLVKSFGKLKAVNDVTLAAPENKIFGLLGPNGAGKTTIIKVLSTLFLPDGGSANVLGFDVASEPEKVREVIGLAGQYAAVDEFQTGYENVYMTGRLYGLKRAEAKKRTHELLERLELDEAANRPVKTYSGGMRRRLDVGASLVGRPKVLFLDEPTTGLDPKSRLGIWQIIRELVQAGTSILLTTQYLEEADELADQIAIINKGKVIAEGTSDQLKTKLGGEIVEFELENANDQTKAMELAHRFSKTAPSFDAATLKLAIPVAHGAKSLVGIAGALNEMNLKISTLSLHRPSLDDVFLSLTGEKVEQPKPEPAAKRRHRR
jgi:ABC-2 type transport system ATP-binding protein